VRLRDRRQPTFPAGYGRQLLVPAGYAAAFAILAWVVLARHGTPYPVDTGPHDWSVAHRPHALVGVAKVVTDAGTGPFPPLAAALGGWLAAGRRTARRRLTAALLAVAVLLAGQLLRTLLMNLFHRARPPVADWAVYAGGHAFPSGHTAASAMAAILLGWGLLRARPGPLGKAAAALCALAAVAVGCTRVYLGVHWPTDVLGGWLFAACWIGAALPLLTAYVNGGGGPSRTGPGADRSDFSGPGSSGELSGKQAGQTETP
jgi:undecaprenyl-diphosphatase